PGHGGADPKAVSAAIRAPGAYARGPGAAEPGAALAGYPDSHGSRPATESAFGLRGRNRHGDGSKPREGDQHRALQLAPGDQSAVGVAAQPAKHIVPIHRARLASGNLRSVSAGHYGEHGRAEHQRRAAGDRSEDRFIVAATQPVGLWPFG